jgi:hypothetical protein
VAHAVRLDSGWVGNLHAQVHSEERAQADLRKAADALIGWADDMTPCILGGDTNTRDPRPPGLEVFGGHDVDFLMGRGVALDGGAIGALDRGPLSDHAPVAADLVRAR